MTGAPPPAAGGGGLGVAGPSGEVPGRNPAARHGVLVEPAEGSFALAEDAQLDALGERVARLVAPGGAILLSTPNVGHYSVVEDLLAGRWDYLPIGLLCYTHLRFFTQRTLEDWLERLGFDRYRLIPQRTEESPRLAAWLEASSEAGDGGLELDRESLRTQGFFVLIHPGPSRWNRPKAET